MRFFIHPNFICVRTVPVFRSVRPAVSSMHVRTLLFFNPYEMDTGLSMHVRTLPFLDLVRAAHSPIHTRYSAIARARTSLERGLMRSRAEGPRI
jgi:hypothetical protein